MKFNFVSTNGNIRKDSVTHAIEGIKNYFHIILFLTH